MWPNLLVRRTIRRSISTSTRSGRWWDHVRPAPQDPIVGVNEAFMADYSPNKINLGLGAYKDDEGKPVVLQCVRDAEAKIASSRLLYSMSAAFSSSMVDESVKLIYGHESNVMKERRLAGVQAISGAGACRLFAELQKRFYPETGIYLPEPTWANHHSIWSDVRVPKRTYRYYHPDSRGLDFPALMDDIKKAPDGSFFLFHPCAHNPTGVDPTTEQWREISFQLKVKKHFPFFDMAYQGFASGDLDQDAQAIRIFLQDGHSMGCAQSFTKNMGLSSHRVGCLSIVCANALQAAAIKSQLQQIARAMYRSPFSHGGLLVSTILSDPDLKELWASEVKGMSDRIRRMRTTLRKDLEKLGSFVNWEHITDQVGMFCFSGLTPDQINRLETEFHIYLTPDGRISMSGVNTGNVRYIANAIHEATSEAESELDFVSSCV